MSDTEDTDLLEIEVPDDEGADVQKPDAISELQRQLDEMRRGKDDADARARDAAAAADAARQEAERVRREAVDAQGDAIGNAIAAEEAAATAAERDYETAMAEGDYAKAAKAQRAMAKAEARLSSLEQSKADAEARKAAPADRREAQGDPVEQAISEFKSERTRGWLREHKDCLTDRKKYFRMIAAHNEAVADDLVPDSAEYFEFVETKLGYRKAEADEADPPARKSAPAVPAQKRAAAPYAAPPSREATSSSGRPTRVTLTAAEIEMARAMDMTPAEYAKHKLDLRRSGDIA